MFPLLRHVGQSSRYAIRPRPLVPHEHIDAFASSLQELLAAAWRCVDTVWSQEFFSGQSAWQCGRRTARSRSRITPST